MKQCSSSKSGSGVTIGRGYDMSNRFRESIINDLSRSGVPIEQAKKISLAARLHNCDALSFVKKYRDEIGEITEAQQLNLFKITYPLYVADSIRFYKKYSSRDAVSWDSLNSKIKDVFIDMKYQGAIKKSDVRYFEKNNIDDVIKYISSSRYLSGFENGRHRIEYLRGN